MPDLLDWLWTPLLTPGRALVGALLLALVAVSAFASLRTATVPGELTQAERRRAGRRLPAWLSLLLAGVGPAALVLGVFLLLFPLSPPRTVLLSSRARVPDEGGSWAAEWRGLLSSAGVPAEVVDAGRLTDEVCRRLGATGIQAATWDLDDPEHRRRLAAAVSDVLGGDLGTGPAGAVEHRTHLDFPPGVCESIELSVLKGLTHRLNVRAIVCQVADRPTRVGRSWDLAADHLGHGSPRLRPTEVVLSRRFEEPGARVEHAAILRRDGDDILVNCLVSVPGSSEAGGRPSYALELGLRVAGRPYALRVGQEFAADPRRTVVDREVRFPAAGGEVEAVVQHGVHARLIPLRKKGGAGAAAKVRLAVDSPDDWRETLRALHQREAFVDWRASMKAFRPAQVTRLEFVESGGGVVIDALSTPRGVWVYPEGFPAARLAGLAAVSDEVGRPVRVGRAAFAGLPRSLSWDGLPLEPQPGHLVAGGAVLAWRTPLAENLIDGKVRRSRPADQPLVTRFDEESGGAAASLTFFSLDPSAQGLLLHDGRPGAGYEHARLVAFWADLFDALDRAAGGRVPEARLGAEESGASDAPLPLLDAAALEALRAESAGGTLAPLFCGLLLFGVAVCRAVAAAPKPSKGRPS